MSPILIFLGISGRFIFFTADTARAGAPAKPACIQKKKIPLRWHSLQFTVKHTINHKDMNIKY